MGGGAGELSGPDFSQGVPAADVAEGKSLLGHAGGEAVLLARVDGDFFAVGATCTHYSGPLAEGMVVGDTVRCPWHHACFSLRSGDAVRAPVVEYLSHEIAVRSGPLEYMVVPEVGEAIAQVPERF